jgi:hypothetical protein
VTAAVTATSGTSTQSFPAGPSQPAPTCPAGAHCASGYGFGSPSGPGSTRSAVVHGAGSTSAGQ